MALTFRKATLEDVSLLRGLEAKLVEHERGLEPTLKQGGRLEYYDIPKLIEDTRNAIVLIAEIDGQTVGCGLGEIKKNDACYNESHYGYIGLMYVDESQRGKNVGGSIVHELTDWFHINGINEVRLKVYASNPGAIRAYEKYGFEPYINEMKLKKPD